MRVANFKRMKLSAHIREDSFIEYKIIFYLAVYCYIFRLFNCLNYLPHIKYTILAKSKKFAKIFQALW